MILYVDGACQGNGKSINKGGYGVVILDDNEKVVNYYQSFSENTTNNREELKAILYAMICYGVKEPSPWEVKTKKPPIVYSDSAYAINTLTNWMFNWEKNGWIKSDKKEPENLDLIQAYFELYQQGYRINLQKVAGHKGNKWNELADALATGRKKI